ncbi:MAG: hypothetical protein AAFX87_05400 [Bacteroidota bacterium]
MITKDSELAPITFQKPYELCQINRDFNKFADENEVKAFITLTKASIESRLEVDGFTLRLAEVEDIQAIRGLIAAEASIFAVSQITESDLYRTIKYGFVVLIEDIHGNIVSFNATEVYADADKTAATIYVAAAKKVSGLKVAICASRYTSLLSMEVGCRVKRTWIGPGNHASFKNHLNHEGYIIDGFHNELYLKGQPRMTITLPLTPAGISNNLIDEAKLKDYLDNNDDHALVACDDLQQLDHLYRNSDMKVVALVSNQITKGSNAFLAVPSSSFESYVTP